MYFFVVCCFFIKINFFDKMLSGIPFSIKQLDPDQVRHFVGPDLGPNCLQRLLADYTSGKTVKHSQNFLETFFNFSELAYNSVTMP